MKPAPRRFDIWLVQLDPTIGREIRKTHPCVIVSPDELDALATVLVAPMTSKGFPYPCRVPCRFEGQSGLILLDQMRAVDKRRLVRRLGALARSTAEETLRVLQGMFAP